MRILEIGVGLRPKQFEGHEVIYLDKFKTPYTDIVWDVEKLPLPFKDNYFDKVYSRNVFEHIRNFVPLIEDIYT
jgi:SAM-dependent methyltransferase